MSDTIITIENLGKRYRYGGPQSMSYNLRQDLTDWARGLWPRRSQRSGVSGQHPTSDLRPLASETHPTLHQIHEQHLDADPSYFWALRDINLEVRQGEVVGIIGRNGSGKSTLLKLLARIMPPTTGKITYHGRVASLLEVGTGFHRELTGRENVFLNGSILGMKRAEIARKFDEIVAFAEIDKFIDTPVKFYSSGMYVRLAFAVAAHLEPDILIVDEVLAVGDASFQKKCIVKMSEVAKQGRTVLFVSHNMGAIGQLTNRCMVISGGLVSFVGTPSDSIAHYVQSYKVKFPMVYLVEHEPRKLEGNGVVRILALEFDRQMPVFGAEEDFNFVTVVRAQQPVTRMRISMTILAQDETPVGNCFSQDQISLQKGQVARISVRIPHPSLAPGRYFCAVAVGQGNQKTIRIEYDIVTDILHFEVTPPLGEDGTISHWVNGWGHVILPEPSIHLEELPSACKP